MIRKIAALSALIGMIPIIQLGCGSKKDDGNGPTPVPPPRVVAAAHQDPTFANALDSPVWDSVTVEKVTIGAENKYNANLLYVKDKFVDMKALTADDSLLYIWVQWDDASMDNRFGELRASWVNNKVQWIINYPEDTMEKNEDRFYILFDQGGPSHADCALICHSASEPSSSGRRFYGASGDNADVWHWKAGRTGLAKLADDMHITTVDVSPDPIAQVGDSLYFINYTFLNPAVDSHTIKPKYMHEDGPAYTGPGLLESEVQGGFFALFDPDLEWVIFPVDLPPVGKTIPGYFVYDESGIHGSRWDVKAISRHDGSKWTVVFRRALTTADGDDISFSLSGSDSIQISIAVCNNYGTNHFGRAPFYLIFQ